MSKRKRVGIAIDMTPMCDVAFLLLIFFMSTTQFKPPEEVAVTLPVSSSEIHVPETGVIILTVNREGRWFIGGEDGQAQEMQKSDLVSAISNWRARNPAAVMVVKGDKTTEFGAVSDLMDALAESKALRFNLMTDLKQKGSAAPAAPAAH